MIKSICLIVALCWTNAGFASASIPNHSHFCSHCSCSQPFKNSLILGASENKGFDFPTLPLFHNGYGNVSTAVYRKPRASLHVSGKSLRLLFGILRVERLWVLNEYKAKPPENPACCRVPRVFKCCVKNNLAAVNADFDVFITKVSPNLRLANFSGLSRHEFGAISRPASVVEGSYYRKERNQGEHHGSNSGIEHPLSPLGHTFLSLKVAVFAALLCLSSYLIFFSYKIADRGFDAFESGRKVYGLIVLLAAVCVGVGSAFFLPWLVFGSGLAPSLGG